MALLLVWKVNLWLGIKAIRDGRTLERSVSIGRIGSFMKMSRRMLTRSSESRRLKGCEWNVV